MREIFIDRRVPQGKASESSQMSPLRKPGEDAQDQNICDWDIVFLAHRDQTGPSELMMTLFPNVPPSLRKDRGDAPGLDCYDLPQFRSCSFPRYSGMQDFHNMVRLR